MLIARQDSPCQQSFSEPCRVNLISKDTHLVFSMYLTFLLSYCILATFYLKTSWGALTNYDMQRESELKDHFREKLATHLSATTKEVWGVELYPGKPRRDNHIVMAVRKSVCSKTRQKRPLSEKQQKWFSIPINAG